MKHKTIWLRIGLLWTFVAVFFIAFCGTWAHDDPPYRRAERADARREYKLHPSQATKAAFLSELSLQRRYEARVIGSWMGALFLVAALSVYGYELLHERKGS